MESFSQEKSSNTKYDKGNLTLLERKKNSPQSQLIKNLNPIMNTYCIRNAILHTFLLKKKFK